MTWATPFPTFLTSGLSNLAFWKINAASTYREDLNLWPTLTHGIQSFAFELDHLPTKARYSFIAV